jgi:hypothetical protein
MTIRNIQMILVDGLDQALPNLNNIYWAVYANVPLSSVTAPLAQGAGLTTDANGLMSLTFTSELSIGTLVRLRLSNSTGVIGQTPPPSEYNGLVNLS